MRRGNNDGKGVGQLTIALYVEEIRGLPVPLCADGVGP